MADALFDLDAQRRLREIERKLHNGTPPTDNGDMEARVTALEDFAKDAKERLTRIETKLDHTATKADVAEAANSQIKWMVGTAAGLGVAAITVMTFVLNNAAPKSPPAVPAAAIQPSQAPIIINVPAAAAPTPTPSKK